MLTSNPPTITDATPAVRYDEYAVVQRRTAEDLLAFTGQVTPCAILELGCGTGLYTRMLLDAFPQATIMGLDISPAMIAVAQRKITDPRVTFQVANAEQCSMNSLISPISPIWPIPPAKDNTCDLITANAAVQWFTDLPGSLARLAGFLAPGGTFTFSFFGPHSYCELDQALGDVCGEEVQVTARRFADVASVQSSLPANMTWQLEERTYRQTFPNLKAVLASIKYTGTRGRHLGSPVTWTPGKLARLEEAYRQRHGDIRASYQVLFCKGTV